MPDRKLKIIDMGTVRKWKSSKAADTVYLGTRATAAPDQFGYSQTDGRTSMPLAC
jgi:serine/threonine-protein kinase